ncbi:hypothetical protein HPB49_023694 [Dermacentor silvarum]|uniref:Uncharacterized protein n=1 Tax=Dermacentor silvarum TaxID=543639 RepID=A0ACB8C5Z9_DERSI|nr:hypothetical protein HPB49_023694 [Dermacentor silvarum]
MEPIRKGETNVPAVSPCARAQPAQMSNPSPSMTLVKKTHQRVFHCPRATTLCKDGNRQRSTAVKATVVAASTIVAGLRPIRPKQALAGDIQKASGSTGAGTVNWLGSRTVQTQVAVEASADSSTVQRLVRAGLGGGQQCEAAQAKNLRMPRDCVDGHQTSMQNLADDTGHNETDGHHQSLFSGSVGDVNVCQSETGAAGPSSLPSSIKISSVYTLVGDGHQHAVSTEERGKELMINGPTVNLQGGVATDSARLTVRSQEAGEEPIHATAGITFEGFADADKDLELCAELTDDEIIRQVTEDSDDSDTENEEPAPTQPTSSELTRALMTLSSVYSGNMTLTEIEADMIAGKRTVQKKISDFFAPKC